MKAEVKKQDTSFLDEIGEIGIKSFSGGMPYNGTRLDVEPLDLLKGEKKYKWYKEMALNDPFVSANYKMNTILGANGKWDIKPGSDSLRDKKVAEFIKENLFTELIGGLSEYVKFSMGSLFAYGFSLSEIVLKKRNDGKYVLKKLSKRLASTIKEWGINDKDEIEFVIQENAALLSRSHKIPYKKLLHCKLDDIDGSPEGIAQIRGAFTSYYTKKHIESDERVRVKKDSRGNLVFKVPMSLLTSKNPNHTDFLNTVKTGLSNISNSNDTYILAPSGDQYSLDVLEYKGEITKDTSNIIERCDRYISTSLLSDFLLLGLKSGGTGNLIQPKIRIYTSFVGNSMNIIKEEINNKLIPTLCKINNLKVDKYPTLVHENLSELLNIEAALALQSAGQWINSIGTAQQYNYIMKRFIGSEYPEISDSDFLELKRQFKEVSPKSNTTNTSE